MICEVTGRRLARCLSCRAWPRWVIDRYVLSWRATISRSPSIFRMQRLPKRDGTNYRSTSFGFPAATTPLPRCRGKPSTPGRSRRSSENNSAADKRRFTQIRSEFALIRVHLRLVLLCEWKVRLDVDRHVLQLIKGMLHGRSDHGELVQYRFRLVVRPFCLQRHQIVRQLRHSRFNLRLIDAERAFRFVELYRAFVSQIVELHRDTAPVRFADSETH